MKLLFILLATLIGVIAEKISVTTTCDYARCQATVAGNGVMNYWDCYFTVTIGSKTWNDFPKLEFINCNSLGAIDSVRPNGLMPANTISSKSGDGAVWVGRVDSSTWCNIGHWPVRIMYAGQEYSYNVREGYCCSTEWTLPAPLVRTPYAVDIYYGSASGYFPPSSQPPSCSSGYYGSGARGGPPDACCRDDNDCCGSCNSGICSVHAAGDCGRCDPGYYGRGGRNGPNGVCCSSASDCAGGGCSSGICVTITSGVCKDKPEKGSGWNGDCCDNSDDCHESCVDGKCNGPSKPTTPQPPIGSGSNSCVSGWCDKGNDAPNGACCSVERDCHDTCNGNGICGVDDGTWRGPLTCNRGNPTTTTKKPTPTPTPTKYCKSGYYSKGLKNGPQGYCCKSPADCLGSSLRSPVGKKKSCE